MISINKAFPQRLIITNCITVKNAAIYSGYSQQYLRRLMRNSKLTAVKVGQLWLIDKFCFDAYLDHTKAIRDQRFGPK